MRKNMHEPVLLDHVCKDLGALVEARMAHIPVTPGSDWRDLPNIQLKLKNKEEDTYTITNIL